MKTQVTREGDHILVKDEYAWPGAVTRYGPFTRARVTRYARLGDNWLPVEVSSYLSGVKEATAEIEWSPDVAHDPTRLLMPDAVRFLWYPMVPTRDAPLVLATEQIFRIKRESVRGGPNDAGRVTIPAGFAVEKSYPPEDGREPDEYIAE